ncbi:DUF4236 domain-containing protein [Salinicola acroporae]|uniref:DUF4236 domain-containing protein n=1 Tax=Salinicola acroporae TaxID=1541440 RepID=A0ABT6I4S0_9GAMM|nr:DUF4236 domain-containing protein [Salinicola acroporae]MDH4572689.1 hypothetical protein [Salinicola acroporae]
MGLRFRRMLRLAPGLRIRLDSQDPVLSIGPRGANLNISRRGIHSHAGIPGSGIYHRQALWKRTSRTGQAAKKRR